ncbi:ComF family protein [Psychroflexus sp. YR1-1]|uniref:ComF family protein n=1 Tax=Psychroflexus aurantiacus TaxID=2709310 RepID=A0A6B3QYX5_9FLAO|nr:phosphoribosyltransferase family protein [Psychroflexus aurantiacus]NEV93002.1 ComF family protein [Psychroflexus aurantiacus]
MLQDFKNFLFPKLCACCDAVLLKDEPFMCTFCRNELPLYPNFFDGDHDLHKILYGRVLVDQAASLFYFEKKGIIQNLIHDLKYKGNEELSFHLGEWLGQILLEAGWQSKIDIVIPVPLHSQRMRERGYNQVEGFGRAIADKLSATYNDGVLKRKSNSKTQVFKNRLARTEVVQNHFYVVGKSDLKDKQVLLVDDLVTTGATLEACSLALKDLGVPKLNIATIAITK